MGGKRRGVGYNGDEGGGEAWEALLEITGGEGYDVRVDA